MFKTAHIYREKLEGGTTNVYNFKVEDCHTYYVSEQCVLVHIAANGYSGNKADIIRNNNASETPTGYVWHHLEDGDGMLLVETKVHSRFHHSGGASDLRNRN